MSPRLYSRRGQRTLIRHVCATSAVTSGVLRGGVTRRPIHSRTMGSLVQLLGGGEVIMLWENSTGREQFWTSTEDGTATGCYAIYNHYAFRPIILYSSIQVQ